jgi:hypothetical protein
MYLLIVLLGDMKLKFREKLIVLVYFLPMPNFQFSLMLLFESFRQEAGISRYKQDFIIPICAEIT